MNRGRQEGRHCKPGAAPMRARAPRTVRREAAPARARASRRGGRLAVAAVAVALLLTLAIGGTVAWLSVKTEPVDNTFLPSEVSCKVTEEFNGVTGVKTDVNVTNTGDIDAFIRVKLVSYRTNEKGEHIGGTAEIPNFTLGTGWTEYGGYYYYIYPVAPGQQPQYALAASMALTGAYTDADGGRQALDVMAEAIQSVPEAAVKAAWGDRFSIASDGHLVVPTN